MPHYLFTSEIEDFLLQLLDIDITHVSAESHLSSIEFGILSWHLHNLYWYPRW